MSNFALKYPLLVVLEKLEQFVPYFVQAGIFIAKTNEYNCFRKRFRNSSEDFIIDEKLSNLWKQERNKATSVSWTNKSTFYNTVTTRKQLSLIDEQKENTLLILKFDAYEKKGKDFLFIEFKENKLLQQKYFDLNDASSKQLYANNLHQFIDFYYKELVQRFEEEEQKQAVLRKIQASQVILTNKWQAEKLAQKESLEAAITLYLKNKSSELEININIDTTALNDLCSFSNNFIQISQILDNCIQDLMKLHQNDFTIFSWNVEMYKSVSLSNKSKKALFKHQKVVNILDGYEISMNQLLKEGQNPTGANLGSHCSPPITAAAISDFKKKKGEKIKEAFAFYPNKWSLLKLHFKPFKVFLIKDDLNLDNALSL